MEEMRSYIISRARRRVGVVAVQAMPMARYRIARVPYVGLPRAVVEQRMQCGWVGPAPPLSDAYARYDGFYQWQADHRLTVVA